jgi:DNA-binding protein HU-beta
MADLNRKDIVRLMVAEVDGLSHTMASACLEALLKIISESLVAQKSVVFQEFGKFGVRQRSARQGVHPQTQRLVEIPSLPVPYFTPSPKLKQLVAGK